MKTVEVYSLGTGKRRTLDHDETEEFLAELKRTRRRKPGKGVFPGIAADCHVEVKGRRKTRHYGLYGRTVLMDEKTKKSWQFYFGLLLLEWLDR